MHRSNYTEQNFKQRRTDAAYNNNTVFLYSAYQGWKKVHIEKKHEQRLITVIKSNRNTM